MGTGPSVDKIDDDEIWRETSSRDSIHHRTFVYSYISGSHLIMQAFVIHIYLILVDFHVFQK